MTQRKQGRRKGPRQRKRRQGSSAKINAIVQHAKMRAFERYELVLTEELHKSAVYQIQRGESRFVYRESYSRRHHIVQLDGKECLVVFDPTRKRIKTFLHMSALEDLVPIMEVEYDE